VTETEGGWERGAVKGPWLGAAEWSVTVEERLIKEGQRGGKRVTETETGWERGANKGPWLGAVAVRRGQWEWSGDWWQG
jgi:hypothetical protein